MDVSQELLEDPLFLTTRTAQALTAICRKALREAGVDDVNPAQLSLMSALALHEGLTPTELAREVMYEKSTLTPLIEKLEASGYLARMKDPSDGRSLRLYLTRKGKSRQRQVEAIVTKATREALAEMPRKVLRHHLEFCQTLLAAEGATKQGP